MFARKPGTYYDRNRERDLARSKAYSLANREEVLRKGKEYRERNKEKIAVAAARRRAERPEEYRARDRIRHQQHAERDKARSHARRLKDPSPSMFQSARQRAAKLGIPFTIVVDDVRALYAAGQCECCEIFVGAERRTAAAGPGRHAATLDRVIPLRGYTPENIALLCWACNRRKNDSTLEQLEQLTAWLRGRLAPKA